MISPILLIVLQVLGSLIAGVASAYLCRSYFASDTQGKLVSYKYDIVKSHARIAELEAQNEKLRKKLKMSSQSLLKERIYMN